MRIRRSWARSCASAAITYALATTGCGIDRAAVGPTPGADSTSAAAPRDAASPAARVPYRAIAVVTGWIHACAILDDRKLKCWGDNTAGQLGLGDPRPMIGSVPGEMGDALQTVDLGAGRTVQAVAATSYATCAILDDGSVKCWGLGGFAGQPGQIGRKPGDMSDHLAPLDFGGRHATRIGMGNGTACAAMDDGTVWCWGGLSPPSPVKVPIGKTVSQLAPNGDDGLLALFDDGSIGVFGHRGSIGVTGAETETLSVPAGRKGVAISGSDSFSAACVVLDDGTATCVNAPPLPLQENVVAVGLWGTGGVAALSSDGTAYGGLWGWCEPSTGPGVPLGQRAVALTGGAEEFGCALLADGGIKCWGQSGSSMNPTLVPAWFGADVSLTETNGVVVPGLWHEVDLGTHP
jgi:hypothetical protein